MEALRGRVQIKFCGLTRVEDARFAAGLGVDAIGLVFTRRSRRFVDTSIAMEIVDCLPPFTATVGLFMDDAPEWIESVLRSVRLSHLQFHGLETPGFCEQWARPYLKALPMIDTDQPLEARMQPHTRACAFVLDGHREGEAGGGGQSFEWEDFAPPRWRPWLLAGGLAPGNVARAIRTLAPDGVDVSSGIETAPGIKCPARMQEFVEEVKRAQLPS